MNFKFLTFILAMGILTIHSGQADDAGLVLAEEIPAVEELPPCQEFATGYEVSPGEELPPCEQIAPGGEASKGVSDTRSPRCLWTSCGNPWPRCRLGTYEAAIQRCGFPNRKRRLCCSTYY
ncbi:Regulator of G-protein signaling 3 [Folsomia candida]|uniref:Regulator of G-protein signaling 3 n=1 Tax=Folsomia candida TaxID=158441 RepID=A0A226DKK4_FOLCA|nr:Regulator of G-protein signaling 3 [Folsomia candida]